MTVAHLQRGLDRLDADVVLQGHGAETDHGNAGAMGFNELHGNLLGLQKGRLAAGLENARSPARCQPGSRLDAMRGGAGPGTTCDEKSRKYF